MESKEARFLEACDELDKALLPNYPKTAKKYNLNVTTLRRRHQGKQRSRKEALSISRQCLTLAEERTLISTINKLSARAMPPTASIVRNLAEEIIGRKVGKN